MAIADSNPFTITIAAAPVTALEIAAAGLAPGESTSAIGGNEGVAGITTGSDGVRQTFQWGNRFHYDHAHRVAHLVGKDAIAGGGDAARSNNVYDALTNTWTTSGRFHIDGTAETGHLYESFGLDPVERTIYLGRWSETYLQRWTFGSPPESDWSATATYGQHWMPNASPTAPPLCWHPNLFGPGDGGLVILRNIDQSDNMELLAWHAATDTFHSIPGTQHDAGGTSVQLGVCEYVRSGDHVIGCSVGADSAFRVAAGSNGNVASGVAISAPPIPCAYTQSATRGVLIDDPTGQGGPYILEKCGTNRVWKLEGGVWVEKPYTHPFPRGAVEADDAQWYVASCHPLGVFWCISQTGSPASLLWRPND
jgi:hypothetical protein